LEEVIHVLEAYGEFKKAVSVIIIEGHREMKAIYHVTSQIVQ